jgi:hypothetical protein
MDVSQTAQVSLREAKATAQEVTREVRPWVRWLARIGIAAKGLVYLVIGYFALRAAMGMGGKTTDPAGAILTLLRQPFGAVLVATMAAGLFGYAAWRFAETALGPSEGSDGVGKRLGLAFNGIVYGALGAIAVKQLVGAPTHNSTESAQHWTAWFLQQPFGQWLVALGGLYVFGTGVSSLSRAYTAKFRKHLKFGAMSGTEIRWTCIAGRIGYAARGIVFLIAGFCVLLAAWHGNPSEARGVDGALDELRRAIFGPWALGVIAAGLIIYGLYKFVEARYRKVWE